MKRVSNIKYTISIAWKIVVFLVFIELLVSIFQYGTNNLSTYFRLNNEDSSYSAITSVTEEPPPSKMDFNSDLETNETLCQEAPWQRPNGSFYMPFDNKEYFVHIGDDILCLVEGTNLTATVSGGNQSCICKPKWYGQWCSIPHVVKVSNYKFDRFPLKPRHQARRFVSAFPFNIEFPMLEARLADHGDLVDAFMILESNYTAYGRQKPLYLHKKLEEGHYSKFSCKFVYIFLSYFPKEAYKDGWIADSLHRDYIAQHGVVHQLHNIQSDDIFWLSDADEVPSREAVLFLKVHDGFPEPIGMHYQRNIYGFFWLGKTNTHLYCGTSFPFLRQVYQNAAIKIRSSGQNLHKTQYRSQLNAYLKTGAKVNEWSFGRDSSTAGWHCSWCGSPEFIRNKLVSAQNGDFPRWGNYPEKLDLGYIRNLIKDGMWFDNKGKMSKSNSSSPLYAPPYVLNHPEKFRDLLENPYI